MRAFLVEHLSVDGKRKYPSVIDCDTIDGAVKKFPGLDRPIALFALDTDMWPRSVDVSRQAAVLLACRVADGRVTLTDAIRDFIERYSRPGSLIPSAA